MKEYVLTTRSQGWNRVMRHEGHIARAVFGLCATQDVPCAVRISYGSSTDSPENDDVVAYMSVSKESPHVEVAIDKQGEFHIDMFQPGDRYTGGHLLIEEKP